MSTPEAEFSAFVRASGARLHRYAYLLTGDRAEAEDLVQTSLAKVYLAWGRMDDTSAAERYTRTTIVRTHTSWWRRLGRRQEFAVANVPETEHTALDDVETREMMWAALARLGVRQRTALVLRYYHDLTEADIAETMGCSVGTVKSQLARGLANLRAHLGDAALEEDLT